MDTLEQMVKRAKEFILQKHGSVSVTWNDMLEFLEAMLPERKDCECDVASQRLGEGCSDCQPSPKPDYEKMWKELRNNFALRFSDKYRAGEVCKMMDALERENAK